jgi:2,3-diaminopropionate biosynthesis protein SbnA
VTPTRSAPPDVAAVLAELDRTRPPTSVATMRADVDGRAVRIGLKLESDNPWGSIKDRTALALVRSVAHRLTHPDAVLVESTSGNLGVALAGIAAALDRRFVAVVDPHLSPDVAARLTDAGAELDVVADQDAHGGYLHARLRRVAELLDRTPHSVWTDQYHNPANPAAHYRGTAPQLLRQMPDVDAVFVAVSTGGTLAGVGRYLRSHRADVRVVAVDVPSSAVFGPPTARRLLTGIGASRRSAFLRPGDWDDVVLVDDAVAVAVCHEVHRRAGWRLGGSGGAVLTACLRYLRDHPELRAPVCLCPDDGSSYLATFYDDRWLADRGLDLAVRPEELRGVRLPEQDLRGTRRTT